VIDFATMLTREFQQLRDQLMKLFQRFVAGSCVLLFCASLLSAQDGATLYKKSCAGCHDARAERVPTRETLRAMSPERVLSVLESGAMISMASHLSAAERRAIAEFVTEKPLGHALQISPLPRAMCAGAPGVFTESPTGPQWNAWGANIANTRYTDTAVGFAAELPRLKLKWAFGFPGDNGESAQPTTAGGRVFVGSQGGKVYSLSAETGCVHWWFEASASVRTAVVIGRIETESGRDFVAFFGDNSATVYAVSAETGKLLWKMKADSHPAARITGSPTFYHGRLYVPVSSSEEASAIATDYPCCSFRGSLVALDGATGKQIWKTYTIGEEARPTKKNKNGTQLWGPSGVAIWSSPTIDEQKNLLYATTGDNYSYPSTMNSDAFLAMDLDSGKILWSRQMTAPDVWNTACRMADKTNCPESNGPDFDFGSPPILVTLTNGRRALVAGQKSGVVHAIDPDKNGEVIWQVRIGKGTVGGAIQWGSAADRSNIYVALSDVGRIAVPHAFGTDVDPKQGGGMFALSLEKGERVWYTPPPGCGERKRCSPAQSAAVSAIPGVAFSGSIDGHLRAYSARDGKILWDFDTVGTYRTVNGVEARGGSLDGAGPAIADGMLFVNSGYAIWGGMPGNVLLAFSVDGK
jgi:polyvinyl alcohol dehydrogenase (cytochrome)